MANRAEAPKAIGVAHLPERARRIERDVAANGLELARIERKLDVGTAVEAQGNGRMDGGCTPAPLLKGGFRRPRLKGGFMPDGGGAGAALRNGFSEQACGIEWGCRGLPPYIQVPRGFNGLHEHETDPKRVEGRCTVVVDNHQEVDVIGHDDAVRERRAGIDLVQREQYRERRFAARRQRRWRNLVDEARQRGGTTLQRERHEEELASPVDEVQLHAGSIANLRDLCKCLSLKGAKRLFWQTRQNF